MSVLLVAAVGVMVWSGGAREQPRASQDGVPPAVVAAQPIVTASAVLQSFEWGGSRRSQRSDTGREYPRRDPRDDGRWRDRERERDRSERRRGDFFQSLFDGDWDEPRYTRMTYRTVCVRLCDGYAWPISFAASESRFDKDALACASSCDAPAKLFVHRNPGESLEQAVDLRGQPYARLKTAFLFRTTYNESCRCRPQAWDQVSLDRHRIYAMEQDLRKGKVPDKQDAQRKIAAAKTELRRSEADARERTALAANAAYTAATGQAAPVVARVERAPQPRVGSRPTWSDDDDEDSPRERSVRARAELERTARQARGAFATPPMGLGGADGQPPPPKAAADWTKKVYGY